MFRFRACITRRSVMIAFISICAVERICILSRCESISVLMIQKRGTIPKTNKEETRPFSPIVSFIALNVILRRMNGDASGKSACTFLQILRSGP